MLSSERDDEHSENLAPPQHDQELMLENGEKELTTATIIKYKLHESIVERKKCMVSVNRLLAHAGQDLRMHGLVVIRLSIFSHHLTAKVVLITSGQRLLPQGAASSAKGPGL